MKGFVGTVLSGAIGLAALYVVGKIAFQAGHDIAKAECKYEQLQRGISAKTAKPETSDEEENGIPEETTDMAGTTVRIIHAAYGDDLALLLGDFL